jgi:hypothetical protein
MRVLDVCCGHWGWSKAFAARGHKCVGIDLTWSEPPENCEFLRMNLFKLTSLWIVEQGFNFLVASTPCEEFSVHGMKHFHKNPPFPKNGLAMFNHVRSVFSDSGMLYVMENVRATQQFVGNAVHHCGPFYLWGSGVPPIIPRNIRKGLDTGGSISGRGATRKEIREYRQRFDPRYSTGPNSQKRREVQLALATIPPELANCVADYAERLLEIKP